MKVLHVVTAFARDEDDPITPWLTETLKRLRRRGIDAQVLAPGYKGLRDQTVHGIPVRRFGYWPLARWENLTHEETTPDRIASRPWYAAELPSYLLCGMRHTARLVRREGFDIVHVHWPLPHALMGWAGRRAGARVVATFYGVELRWLQGRIPLGERFLRWTARSSDYCTAISKHTALELAGRTCVGVDVIPFGAGFEPPPEPPAPPCSGAGPREVLFVGRLVERKGVADLIDAMALMDTPPGARLTVVGDGPLRPALEARARDRGLGERVCFTGFVAANILKRHFASADLFVLPAVVDAAGTTEGLGVVLIEALSYRRPVVATRIGGITDIIEDGYTGILVPPHDVKALAAAMASVLADPERARALGNAGAIVTARKFSTDRIVTELIAVYETVLRQPRAS